MNVKELKELCEKEITKGNGDKKILISGDDEGNTFHSLYFAFTEIDNTNKDDYVGSIDDHDIDESNIKEYIILG